MSVVIAKFEFAAKHIMALSKKGGGEASPVYKHVNSSNRNIYMGDRYNLPHPPPLGKKKPEKITERRE